MKYPHECIKVIKVLSYYFSVVSSIMSKQYVFNITVNEKDADVKRDASISNDSLSSIASSMSSDNMSKFAEKYLNIKQNQWGFNFTLLKYWRKHASRNAKQVLFSVKFSCMFAGTCVLTQASVFPSTTKLASDYAAKY